MTIIQIQMTTFYFREISAQEWIRAEILDGGNQFMQIASMPYESLSSFERMY